MEDYEVFSLPVCRHSFQEYHVGMHITRQYNTNISSILERQPQWSSCIALLYIVLVRSTSQWHNKDLDPYHCTPICWYMRSIPRVLPDMPTCSCLPPLVALLTYRYMHTIRSYLWWNEPVLLYDWTVQVSCYEIICMENLTNVPMHLLTLGLFAMRYLIVQDTV